MKGACLPTLWQRRELIIARLIEEGSPGKLVEQVKNADTERAETKAA
jgi:hypothetical protein